MQRHDDLNHCSAFVRYIIFIRNSCVNLTTIVCIRYIENSIWNEDLQKSVFFLLLLFFKWEIHACNVVHRIILQRCTSDLFFLFSPFGCFFFIKGQLKKILPRGMRLSLQCKVLIAFEDFSHRSLSRSLSLFAIMTLTHFAVYKMMYPQRNNKQVKRIRL